MKINDTPIYIGTSGYNYEDWKGEVVPSGTVNYDLLTYYASTKMNFLELTYTFYKLPVAEKIAGIAERLGSDIKLSVRLTKSLMRRSPSDEDIKAFKDGIKPLVESGKIVALLADFHQQFTASRENFSILQSLDNIFDEVPVFFELNNSTWHKERFYEEFKAADLGIVTVDSPNLRGLAPYYPICSNNFLYFRLYGRNKQWLNPQDKMLDYSYSDSELKRFIADINDKSVFAKDVLISFCNVEKAHAPKDAQRMIEMIG